MASLLGIYRSALRTCVHAGRSGGLALILASLLGVGGAHAATSSSPVDVTWKQSGPSVPQTPSGNTMSVLVPITIGVAAIGAAAVAIPATGAIAITGDVMASAGMTAIRAGIIGGVALSTLMNQFGGDLSLDANGNVVAPVGSSPGVTGHYWVGPHGNYGSAIGACEDSVPFFTGLPYDHASPAGDPAYAGSYECFGTGSGGPVHSNYVWESWGGGSCIFGYIYQSDGTCKASSQVTGPATDAQIEAAMKAHPSSWPEAYNDAGCSTKPALTNVDGAGSNDPCAVMFAASSGFGVSFPTGGSKWSNGGCAVSSASCPSATTTTAPQTDTQTKTNADGSTTKTTTTTTQTTTVNGTNDRTNPVVGQTTTTTSTSATTTNPDGSTTTTTTTTTDQAPPQTGTNPGQQQQDKQQPTTATFNGNTADLYKAKGKTFAQVLQGFVSRVQVMPWYSAMTGFFNVTIGGGSCPHWAVPATRWNGPLDMTPYMCSSTMLALYAMGGAVVLAVAAWAAFKIAFL